MTHVTVIAEKKRQVIVLTFVKPACTQRQQYKYLEYKIKNLTLLLSEVVLWEHTGSNRGPSACKADALNQLSYAPFLFWECKDKRIQ